MSDKKILIAYYSHSGNTKAAAEKIQKITSGDIFEIKPVKPYPQDYNTVVAQAQKENNENFLPEIINASDINRYDIIFVGTPVWWYTMAGPVKTFLTQNDFSGKTIVPFCTHGGGGASSTYSDMQKLAPQAKILNGFTSYGDSAGLTDIQNWIQSLNI